MYSAASFLLVWCFPSISLADQTSFQQAKLIADELDDAIETAILGSARLSVWEDVDKRGRAVRPAAHSHWRTLHAFESI
jgi:hypothetical protein